MLAGIKPYTEQEIADILRRYGRSGEWVYDDEKSARLVHIFRHIKEGKNEDGYAKVEVIRPDYLFVDRHNAKGELTVGALYQKSGGKIKRLLRKRNRGKQLPETLFSMPGAPAEKRAAPNTTGHQGGL